MAKCRVCKQPYVKLSLTHRACSPTCSIILVREDKDKRYRKETAEKKIQMRSRRDWVKIAQSVFNQWVRVRDANLPCISCQRHHEGQYHAGHYLSTGAHPELRFNEFNNNKQCSACNNHLSGNIALYRINLIKKIGLENVEWLEGQHEPKKYTVEDLKEIIANYKSKLKELK
ncbi:MAG: recombination protein NinG [Desulfobulbaceae bacterium]|nr:recombination protein NinG [Desulfobulbaceae bacterium]